MLYERKKNQANTIVSRTIGRKTAVWLSRSNRYILADPPAREIAYFISVGYDSDFIHNIGTATMGFPESHIVPLEKELRELISGQVKDRPLPRREKVLQQIEAQQATAPFLEKYYLVFDVLFKVSFSSVGAERFVHPKFAHLETDPVPAAHHHFHVSARNGYYGLRVNGDWAGIWPEKEEHLMGGMFSMKLLEKIYGKRDNEWMAVFHAAGISNGKRCLMFAGGSGAGKSTLSAMLMSRGYDVLADDFLPAEGQTGLLCRFPAAISVKKEAVDLLAPVFPGLANAKKYSYPKMGKTVRYLPSVTEGENKPNTVPCAGLVFINYQPGSDFCMEEMPQEEAFAQLVPDSWIYPSKENARRFLEWFSLLPCYRLTWSDNEKMIKEVKGLFKE